jgi:hypothetical protein
MKNMMALILLASSTNIWANDYTENVYRKVYTGYDFENHPYLVISDDRQTLIYSTGELYARHNAVPSIILSDEDFQNLINQFK